jgi:hypothetical protein
MFQRRTYHSPRAAATYEQCPWNREHVENLYRNLRGNLVEDGVWHDFPHDPRWIGRYRIRLPYFQAVYADTPSDVFDALQLMEPVATDHDAEWEIWPLADHGYAVSSSFATTAGPFLHQETVNKWLERHSLALELGPLVGGAARFVEGVAYFEQIESGCFGDALERLAWLERALMELEAAFERTSEEFWAALERESDRLAELHSEPLKAGEIIPLPSRFMQGGVKQRTPV